MRDVFEILISLVVGAGAATWWWNRKNIKNAADRAADALRKP